MIWDYIRDFLVQNVFGGTTSDGQYFSGFVGNFRTTENGIGLGNLDDIYLPMNGYNDYIGDSIEGICLGDYLSTTTTIIIMALAVVLMCLLVRWIWRVVSSAMLLK